MVLLFAVFLTLMFMGVPISFSMLGSSVAYLLITGFPLEVAVQSIASAIGNLSCLLLFLLHACRRYHEPRRNHNKDI